jgi:predicted dehydrogenase
MRWGIIGCGLIGQKRATALRALGHTVASVADSVGKRAEVVAADYGANAIADWKVLAAQADLDAVVVATSPDWLSPIAVACLEQGKHVLVEKPAGRTLAEVRAIADVAQREGHLVKVGYNHRFHPAMRKAHAIVQAGDLGPLMFIRGRYGHGGRLGYQQEWRFRPEISGGGELIDQGSHLIDLAHWFLGDFTELKSMLRNYYWKASVEDNCFLTLSTAKGQVAWLHATWTEWKNTFSFEISGRDGKLEISGLGGSYGVETLSHYRMLPQMGPPETTRWEWPFPDKSWDIEVAEFVAAIAEGRRPVGDIEDALVTMSIIDRIYRETTS